MDILTKAIAILGAIFGAIYYIFHQGKQVAKSEQKSKENEENIKILKTKNNTGKFVSGLDSKQRKRLLSINKRNK